MVQDVNELFRQAMADLNAGRLRDAERRFGKLLKQHPKHPGLLNLMGLVLLKLERWADAERAIRSALALAPNDAVSLHNFGSTLLKLKRPKEAIDAFDRANALQPNPEAWNNRGIACNDLLRLDEAQMAFRRAVALNPGYFEAYANLAKTLLLLRRAKDAIVAIDQALRLNDKSANIWILQSDALARDGQTLEAVAACDQALVLEPKLSQGHIKRGNLLATLGRHPEAVESFDRALSIDPLAPEALGGRLFSQLSACDWRDLLPYAQTMLAGLRKHNLAIEPGFLISAPAATAEDQLTAARIHTRAMSAQSSNTPPAPRRDGRLRIAYLSADFHDHATAILFAGVLEHHRKDEFEIVGLSYGPPSAGLLRQRIQTAMDRFVEVGDLSDAEIRDQLRAMDVHIAIDLKGFTQDSRPAILASRGAPIQVNYLGYPATMGMKTIDYMIADRFVIPPEQHRFYTEKIVTLPHSYQPNDDRRELPASPLQTRTAAGLPDEGVVFCCFNASYKITPMLFDIWMRLLKAVERSVLWLFESNADACGNLRTEAAARGVAPERLVFAPRLKADEHLSRIMLADLFLDTLPCNAHTTAADALWVGLPFLTCPGETFAGRVGASLLTAMDCPELIAPSLEAYEQTALRLAQEPARLAALKSKLADKRATAPLFRTAAYTRYLERAYSTMWDRYSSGQPPASFGITA